AQVGPMEQQISGGRAVTDCAEVLLQFAQRVGSLIQPRTVTLPEQFERIPEAFRQQTELVESLERRFIGGQLASGCQERAGQLRQIFTRIFSDGLRAVPFDLRFNWRARAAICSRNHDASSGPAPW